MRDFKNRINRIIDDSSPDEVDELDRLAVRPREPKAHAIGSINFVRKENIRGRNARFSRNARGVKLGKMVFGKTARTEGSRHRLDRLDDVIV